MARARSVVSGVAFHVVQLAEHRQALRGVRRATMPSDGLRRSRLAQPPAQPSRRLRVDVVVGRAVRSALLSGASRLNALAGAPPATRGSSNLLAVVVRGLPALVSICSAGLDSAAAVVSIAEYCRPKSGGRVRQRCISPPGLGVKRPVLVLLAPAVSSGLREWRNGPQSVWSPSSTDTVAPKSGPCRGTVALTRHLPPGGSQPSEVRRAAPANGPAPHGKTWRSRSAEEETVHSSVRNRAAIEFLVEDGFDDGAEISATHWN